MTPWLWPVLAETASRIPEWILRLLSVDPARLEGGTERLRFARFPEGGWGLLVVLAFLAGCAAIVWNYRREGALPAGRKLFLAAFRCLALAAAAAVLLYPVLEVDRRQELRAVTVLLVDASLSQTIRDSYRADAARRDATALALGLAPEDVPRTPRSALVARALESPEIRLFSRLAASNPVRAYAFSSGPLEPLYPEEVAAEPVPGAAEPPRFLRLVPPEPRGAATDISGAILSALEEQGAEKVAAVVLLTDGRVTAGEGLGRAAVVLRDRGVPAHAVGVGDPTPARNVRVAAVLASERVFAGDPVAVDVRLEAEGFEGTSVRVELLDAYEPPGEEARAPAPIGAEDASFPAGRAEASARFEFPSKGVGRHTLIARIPVHPEETLEDDNQRAVTIEVVKEASKVLLISGGPTFEYRFLKNLLRRDSRVRLAAWLMSADVDYPQEGDVSLKSLPATAKELFEHDVVILMDVDPRGLPPSLPELLERFVSEHRGGLLYAAGDKHSAAFFEVPSAEPVRKMLPVVVDPSQLREELEKGKYYERLWPLVPTAAALGHAAVRLSSQPERNRERWAQIAGFYWALPVRKAKPGATVLFVHPNPALSREGEPLPLVAVQFYGGGRTAWCGIDATWRWRATAEEVYDRFWIQTVRYLTEGRLLGDRRRIVETDRESYELGETCRISALIQDETYRPIEAEEVPLRVEAPGGEESEVRLRKDPSAPGWFRGTFAPRRVGRHTFRLDGAERSVPVEPPAVEFAAPRLDEAALEELAQLTGGTYRPLAEVASLPEAVPDRRQVVVTTDEPIPLWDNWTSLGLIAGLLTIEWILRKIHRLL